MCTILIVILAIISAIDWTHDYQKSPRIDRKRVEPTNEPVQTKPQLDQDAILALQSLQGISKTEATNQVAKAMGMQPSASTQELIVLCLKNWSDSK